MDDNPLITETALANDLAELGIEHGDDVMVHASVSRLGPLLGGPDALIAALRRTVGHSGTVLAYADWNVDYDAFLDTQGRVLEEWRDHIPTFDPAASRASRDHGVFPEFLRTTPGATRSGNPGASMVALGTRAEHYTASHPLDYGYGEGTPLARLVVNSGKVAMLGAPLDTMTMLHHAEHLARLAEKRIRRYEVPLVIEGRRMWRQIEEFETSVPVVDTLQDDCFTRIVDAFLASGQGVRAKTGNTISVLVDAAAITAYAVGWLENHAPNPPAEPAPL